jgi:hypothetical protein
MPVRPNPDHIRQNMKRPLHDDLSDTLEGLAYVPVSVDHYIIIPFSERNTVACDA